MQRLSTERRFDVATPAGSHRRPRHRIYPADTRPPLVPTLFSSEQLGLLTRSCLEGVQRAKFEGPEVFVPITARHVTISGLPFSQCKEIVLRDLGVVPIGSLACLSGQESLRGIHQLDDLVALDRRSPNWPSAS